LQPASIKISSIAGIGHIAVGLASARSSGAATSRRRAWLTVAGYVALAMLPDVDVLIGCLFKERGPLLDHRGLTHTPMFALWVGLVVFAFCHRSMETRAGAARAGVVAALLVGSHCLLDAMAQDGRGMLFLWPFSLHRYHFRFRPIPDIPTGLLLFSRLGLRQLLTEALLFLPLVVHSLSWRALWRPERTAEVAARVRAVRPRGERRVRAPARRRVFQ
jgi:inner membrane protein